MPSVTHPLSIFIERIMSVALEEHDGKVSLSSRNITDVQFSEDKDAVAQRIN